MSETKTFDATIIRAGAYRTLRQSIRYENGRAVAYQCPWCHDWHPLKPRDWDEASGCYVGRDCGEPVLVRAAKNAYQREYYATHPEFRDRQRQRAREWQRARRAEAARRAAQGGAG